MKSLKISFLAITAVFAVCLSAFTTPKKTVTTDGWFELKNPARPDLASSYEYAGEMSPCSGSDELCAIKGVRNPNPAIDIPYQTDVDNAQTNSSNFSHAVSGQVEFKAN